MYIFIIYVVTPAGTQNPLEIRGCGCRNAPAGLPAGEFVPTPRVYPRAGFHQIRTRIRGCHPPRPERRRARWQQLLFFSASHLGAAVVSAHIRTPTPHTYAIHTTRVQTDLQLHTDLNRVLIEITGNLQGSVGDGRVTLSLWLHA